MSAVGRIQANACYRCLRQLAHLENYDIVMSHKLGKASILTTRTYANR